jgi:hypothetical protein
MIKLTANRGSISIRKEGTLPPVTSEDSIPKKEKKAKDSEIRM